MRGFSLLCHYLVNHCITKHDLDFLKPYLIRPERFSRNCARKIIYVQIYTIIVEYVALFYSPILLGVLSASPLCLVSPRSVIALRLCWGTIHAINLFTPLLLHRTTVNDSLVFYFIWRHFHYLCCLIIESKDWTSNSISLMLRCDDIRNVYQ